MDSEKAFGHTVKCQELLRVDRGVTTSAVEPPKDPRVNEGALPERRGSSIGQDEQSVTKEG
jgi:hypothetical protein